MLHCFKKIAGLGSCTVRCSVLPMDFLVKGHYKDGKVLVGVFALIELVFGSCLAQRSEMKGKSFFLYGCLYLDLRE